MERLALQDTRAPGWAEVGVPDLNGRVLVKVGRSDGRWVVTTLVVLNDTVTAATLRAVPVAQIEAMLNNPEYVGAWYASDQVSAHETDLVRRHMKTWRDELGQVDAGLTAYFEGSRPHAWEPADESPREPLRRPDGSDPEAFYRQVAEAYTAAVQSTSKPAKVLADEAGVPVATVHRWIHEARRRGLLPPARRGRAG